MKAWTKKECLSALKDFTELCSNREIFIRSLRTVDSVLFIFIHELLRYPARDVEGNTTRLLEI